MRVVRCHHCCCCCGMLWYFTSCIALATCYIFLGSCCVYVHIMLYSCSCSGCWMMGVDVFVVLLAGPSRKPNESRINKSNRKKSKVKSIKTQSTSPRNHKGPNQIEWRQEWIGPKKATTNTLKPPQKRKPRNQKRQQQRCQRSQNQVTSHNMPQLQDIETKKTRPAQSNTKMCLSAVFSPCSSYLPHCFQLSCILYPSFLLFFMDSAPQQSKAINIYKHAIRPNASCWIPYDMASLEPYSASGCTRIDGKWKWNLQVKGVTWQNKCPTRRKTQGLCGTSTIAQTWSNLLSTSAWYVEGIIGHAAILQICRGQTSCENWLAMLQLKREPHQQCSIL